MAPSCTPGTVHRVTTPRPSLPPVWYALRHRAHEASATAYAPYSKYFVGAAAEMEDGTILSGANVENASYGLTLCAECTLVAKAATSRHGRILRLVCVNGDGEIIPPCGRCRQVIAEHAADEFLLLTEHGEMTLEEMLPWGFGPHRLADAGSSSEETPA